MSEMPGLEKDPFYVRDLFIEGIAGCAAIGALIYQAAITHTPWLTVPAGLVLVPVGGKIVKAVREDKGKAEERAPNDLVGCLKVMHGATLAAAGEELAENKLRVTLWKVLPPGKKSDASEWLQQITPYVGGTGGRIGRRHSIHAGCIGKAARENEPHVMHRQSEDEKQFRKELMALYSYTKNQARDVDERRWSAMAVPIFGPEDSERTIGVVFLDCEERDFFTGDVRTVVIGCCSGLAKYIHARSRK